MSLGRPSVGHVWDTRDASQAVFSGLHRLFGGAPAESARVRIEAAGNPEELEAVRIVLASGWVAGQGPTCLEFERRFASTCGTSHALATSNCTSALHLALLALGVRAGDEVVVADYTFPATGHAVMHAQARPTFADVRPDIWTIDVAAAEAAITYAMG